MGVWMNMRGVSASSARIAASAISSTLPTGCRPSHADIRSFSEVGLKCTLSDSKFRILEVQRRGAVLFGGEQTSPLGASCRAVKVAS